MVTHRSPDQIKRTAKHLKLFIKLAAFTVTTTWP
jgi:hypothetical protein